MLATELLFPEEFAFARLAASAGAGIGNREIEPIDDNRAGHVGCVLSGVPNDVGLGDVSTASWINRHHVFGRKPTGHVEILFIVNQ